MSNHAFEITPKRTDVLELDQGKGDFEIVVSNRLGKEVSAHARLEPVGDTRAEWLTLARPERDFAADGTQTFHARIDVPRGTPVGRYKFRMIVGAHTDTPDEDQAASEPLVAQYSGHPQRPWYLLVAVLAGVVVLGLGGYGLYAWLSGDDEVTECDGTARAVRNDATGKCECPEDTAVRTLDGKKSCLCSVGLSFEADSRTCQYRPCPASQYFSDATDACTCIRGLTNSDNKCKCTLRLTNNRLVPVGVNAADDAACACPSDLPIFDPYTQECTKLRFRPVLPRLEKLKDLSIRRDINLNP